MINFYLHNKACDVSDITKMVDGLSNFMIIKHNGSDNERCWIHYNFWNLNVVSECTFYTTIPAATLQFLYQIRKHNGDDCCCDDDLDCLFNGDSNAYLGIDFTQVLDVSKDRQIIDNVCANSFRRLSYIKLDNFWDNRNTLYPNLIFCSSTKSQIHDCTSQWNKKSHEAFNILNAYLNDNQSFNWNVMMRDIFLNISNESESTMKNEKFRKERTFSLPNNSQRVFSYHVKYYDGLRIYIDKVDGENKLYIGYIGKHLDTKLNKMN